MTKTQRILRVLANGGNVPEWCCMTIVQKLLSDAATRVNSLQEEVEAFIPITNAEIDNLI